MKIIFAGTPETAVPTLSALAESTHEIVAVITRPDAPLGRKRVITPSPVAEFAHTHGIPTVKTALIDSEVHEHITRLNADLGVVVAYGAFLPQPALDATAHGWINLHFSKLPALRGAAPVQWTLINGSTEAHTTVFKLVSAMDAGPICSVESVTLRGDETATQLLHTLSLSGASQVLSVVNDVESGNATFCEQVGTVTLAPKLSVDDGELIPSRTGIEIFNRYRGVTQEPGAWIRDGQSRVKVLDARLSGQRVSPGEIVFAKPDVFWGTATEALELITVQPAGKSAMSAADWVRGRR